MLDLAFEFKTTLAGLLDGNNLVLLMVAALAIQFTIAAVLHRRVSETLPWTAAAIAVVLNEMVSLVADRRIDPGEEFGALRDVAVGMLLPTALLLAARHLPRIFVPVTPVGPKRFDAASASEESAVVDAEFEEIS